MLTSLSILNRLTKNKQEYESTPFSIFKPQHETFILPLKDIPKPKQVAVSTTKEVLKPDQVVVTTTKESTVYESYSKKKTGPRRERSFKMRVKKRKKRKPVNTSNELSTIEKELENLEQDNGTVCEIPKLDPFAEEVMKFDKKYPQITCKGRDWVRCYISKCKMDPMVLKTIKNAECEYMDIIYRGDNGLELGPKQVLKGDHEYTLSTSDHVVIRCRGVEGHNSSSPFGKSWSGHGAGFRPLTPKKPPPVRERIYNALIFGFHSTSKNLFIRKMPKSYRFLKEELKSVIFNGYNIVGDGTAKNIFPILTGKAETELPGRNRSNTGNEYLDSVSLIFYKLKEDGYRTGYFEDMPSTGALQSTFNNGFLHQPADHYLRDFITKVAKDNLTNAFCVGDTPRYQLVMNLTDQFHQLDGKKFSFTFLADITHDPNYLSSADDALVKFLRGLMRRAVFNDTLFILMADHGPRFGDSRELEERLPMMAIRLPDSLKVKRPDAQSALELNADVLTTPHDIHATLLDVLDMKQHWNDYKIKGADLTRGLTLLEPIPKNRSCSAAGIERHWCSCGKWEQVPSTDTLFNRIAKAVVDHINSVTRFIRKLCVRRTLTSISWVMHKTDNKMPALDFNSNTLARALNNTGKQLYQVKIEVGPGRAVYEATVTHLLRLDKLYVITEDIYRTNGYSDEPRCLGSSYLSPFCHCDDYPRTLQTRKYKVVKTMKTIFNDYLFLI